MRRTLFIALLLLLLCSAGVDGANTTSSVSVGNASVANISANASVLDYYSTSNDSITFFAHADWGKGGWDGSQADRRKLEDVDGDEDRHEEEKDHKEEVFYQGYTARSMAYVVNVTGNKPSFVLALGDNFYNDGVASINDSMWYNLFRDVYFRSSALRSIPWHAAFGNHDLGYGSTGVQAQINRTAANTTDDDGVWDTKGQWYSVRYAISSGRSRQLQEEDGEAVASDHSRGGGFVQVVIVDTTWLAPSENEATNEEGGVSVQMQAYRIERQLEDLETILNKTLVDKPSWLIVAGHYPMFSRGEKGDNEELGMYLRPLLERYNVHAYMCGHDHIAEHLQYSGINYFVTGHSTMNNQLDEDVTSNATLIWAGESTSGFTRLTATDWILHIEFVEANSSAVLYQHTLTNPLLVPVSLATDAEGRSTTDDDDDDDGLLLRGYHWLEAFLEEATDTSEQAALLAGGIVFLASAVLSFTVTSLLRCGYRRRFAMASKDNKRFGAHLKGLHAADNLPPGPMSGMGAGFGFGGGAKSLYLESIESSHNALALNGSSHFNLLNDGGDDDESDYNTVIDPGILRRMPGGRWLSPTKRYSGVAYETLSYESVVPVTMTSPHTTTESAPYDAVYDSTSMHSSSMSETSDLTANTNLLSVHTIDVNQSRPSFMEDTRPRRNSVV